jgi:hypothetical protein
MAQSIEYVAFDSRNFFYKFLLDSTPTLLTIPHGLAWCARNSGLSPLQAACAAFLGGRSSPSNTAAKTITFHKRWLGTHQCYQN